MLTGKKFPMCMRALRMVVEVILEPIINAFSVQGYDGFIAALEQEHRKVGHVNFGWIALSSLPY